MVCTFFSIQLIHNGQVALRRLLVVGQTACHFVLVSMFMLSSATAQPIEEPLFGITIRNSTLEQRFLQTRTEQERVTKVILNSDVLGQQETTTETRVRILPDPNHIRFDLINRGDVTSQTTSVNRQVLIDGAGQHHFEITKPFWFDGKGFLTQPGYGTIQANQRPQRVVSAIGAAMPLLSPLADRVAWEQVSQQQAKINQAVAEDVCRDALPKINRLADEEFARLEQQLAGIRIHAEATLKSTPFRWAACSTDTTFSMAAVLQRDSATQPVATVAMPLLAAGEEVAFTMSESVATALLEQYVPGGLMLADTQVEKAAKAWNRLGDEKWSVRSLRQLMQDLDRYSNSKPAGFSIELAEIRPLEVRFDRGDICLETAFQIVPAKGVPSGGMKMTWRLHGRGVSADQWAVALHHIDVGDADDLNSVSASETLPPTPRLPELRIPVDGEFAPGVVDATDPEITTVEAGTSWISVVTNSAQSLLPKIPPATMPREFDLQKLIPGSPKVRLVRIESADGVLRASFRFVDDPPPSSPGTGDGLKPGFVAK